MFYNERIGIGIGTLTSFQTLDWIVQMRIISEGGGGGEWRDHLLFSNFDRSPLSPRSFSSPFFHSILDFRAIETRLVIY